MQHESIYNNLIALPLPSDGSPASSGSDPLQSARNLLPVANESDWKIWLEEFGAALDVERVSVIYLKWDGAPEVLFQAHQPPPPPGRFSLMRRLNTTPALKDAIAHPCEPVWTSVSNDPFLTVKSTHLLAMATRFEDTIALFVLRRTSDRPFDSGTIDALEGCAEELARAAQTHIREYRAKWDCGSLQQDLLPPHLGVLIVDAQLNVVFSSKLAQELLGRQSGLWMGQGKLLGRKKHMSNLSEAIKECIAEPELIRGLNVPSGTSTGSSLAVVIHGIKRPHPNGWNPPQRAQILLGDPKASSKMEIDLIVLRYCHGFTQAEARTAWAIASGLSTGEIALMSDLSKETVRSQLSSATRRIGVSGQVNLTRYLIMSPAFWAAMLGRKRFSGKFGF